MLTLIRYALSLLPLFAATTVVDAQSPLLTFSIFSGTDDLEVSTFNFADNGSIHGIELGPGGTSLVGPVVDLFLGGSGDTTFFFDHTSGGDTFYANDTSGAGLHFVASGGTSASLEAFTEDGTDVAIDETNGFVYFNDRSAGLVNRAPLNGDFSIGAPEVFLAGLFEPSSLSLTDANRLLIGTNGSILAFDPGGPTGQTGALLASDTGGQTRGLEEDAVNGLIYYSTDATDSVSVVPSGGGASSLVVSLADAALSNSVQDLVLDRENNRLIVASFNNEFGFEEPGDGALISFALDRATGAATDGGVVLLDNTSVPIGGSSAISSFFTGVNLLQLATADTPGDFDADGDVDDDDFGVFAGAFGGAGPLGDFDNDGDVDDDDFGVFAGAFGTGVATTAIPEPATGWLVAMASGVLPARRRR